MTEFTFFNYICIEFTLKVQWQIIIKEPCKLNLKRN